METRRVTVADIGSLSDIGKVDTCLDTNLGETQDRSADQDHRNHLFHNRAIVIKPAQIPVM